MDQHKIGTLIKELRKQHGLTQEQFAEQFNVNRRTVSRWETGSNLPDLDILIEIADHFGIELRQLLNGAITPTTPETALTETVSQVVEYSNTVKQQITRRMHLLFIAGFMAAVIYMVLLFTDHADNFFGGLCLGITDGMMLVGIFLTSKHAAKISEYKAKQLKQIR